MNLLDVAVLVWAGFAAFSGYRRGAALQLTEYVGLLLGLLVGAVVAPSIARLFSSSLQQATIALVILLSFAALGEAAGWLLGRRVWAFARRSALRPLDSAGGSLVSVVAVLLVTWFVGYSLVNGPLPSLSEQIRTSRIVRTLNEVLPRPPSVLAEVRGFLNRFGFPEVFADLPPAPAGPVKNPSDPTVREIQRRHQDSLVRVVGQACGAIQSGSGFVAAEHYVVTNAHVVAGVSRPEIQSSRGADAATPVLFDPKLDVAILYVAESPGPVLALDPQDVMRGADGAILGYPGGGPLVSSPSAVRRELNAVGRDIYGSDIVTRPIYELQAAVRPGDSGGPFILRSGQVAGVMFAASTTDPGVGYALTSPQVLDELHTAQGRTGAVSTSDCAR